MRAQRYPGEVEDPKMFCMLEEQKLVTSVMHMDY